MQKRLLLLGIIGIISLTLCQSANAMGIFYTNANYPVTATGVPTPTDLALLKEGKSSAVNVLWCVEVGDAGINKAAKAGNIKNISFIDINEKTIFVFFRKITTTVYGN